MASFSEENAVVYNGIQGDANYPTPPSSPNALTDLDTATNNAITARTAWGSPGNHGTTNDLQNYKAKIKTLYDMLLVYCNYVNMTTPGDAVAISGSGFPVGDDHHPLPLLNPPADLRRLIRNNIGLDTVKLKVNRPSNASDSQRINFKFFRSTTPNFADATVIGERTKTTHIDAPAVTTPTTFYYWTTAISPAGESDPSDLLKVTVVPL